MIATALLLSGAAVAGENGEKTPFALEFRTGAEYDSNVAVLELDTATGASDVAAVIDFHAGFDKRRPKSWSFDVAYDFSQSLYRQLDTYDLRIHRGSAGVGYDFGAVETGLSYQYVSAALANGEDLTLSQITPHLGTLLGKRVYLRLAWDRTHKTYAMSPGRDATTDAPSVDAYVFVDGVKSYLLFGYEHAMENAADDTFDYDGDKLKAQLTERFVRGSRSLTLKTGLRYESRTYRAPSLPFTPRREDQRYRFELELEAMVTRHMFLRARYEYARNRSTEASVNFDENVASIGLGARL
jgi:surface lipoprotein assembly modifier-like protein